MEGRARCQTERAGFKFLLHPLKRANSFTPAAGHEGRCHPSHACQLPLCHVAVLFSSRGGSVSLLSGIGLGRATCGQFVWQQS